MALLATRLAVLLFCGLGPRASSRNERSCFDCLNKSLITSDVVVINTKTGGNCCASACGYRLATEIGRRNKVSCSKEQRATPTGYDLRTPMYKESRDTVHVLDMRCSSLDLAPRHLARTNPLPYPGTTWIVVGAVHGRRSTRAGRQGRPRGRLVAPDGSPGPPKCVF